MSEPTKQPNKFTPPTIPPSPSFTPLPSSAFTTPSKFNTKSAQIVNSKTMSELKDNLLSTVDEAPAEIEHEDVDEQNIVKQDPIPHVNIDIESTHKEEINKMKQEFDLAMLQLQNELHYTRQYLQDTESQRAYLEYQARSQYQFPSENPNTITQRSFISTIGKPDKFNGDYKMNPATWIDTIREYAHLTGMPPDTHTRFAISYLNGSAREWITSWSQEEKIASSNFEVFAQMVLKRYRPVDAARTARNKLVTLRQTGSVDVYNTLFIQNVQVINDMSMADQIHHYKQGLKQPVYEKLMFEEFSTLNDMMNAATKVDHILYTTVKRTSNYVGNGNHYNIRSHVSNVPTEVNNVNANVDIVDGDGSVSVNAVRFQKLTPVERTQMMKEGRCFKCRERGHMANSCPTKNNAAGFGMKPSGAISNTKKW